MPRSTHFLLVAALLLGTALARAGLTYDLRAIPNRSGETSKAVSVLFLPIEGLTLEVFAVVTGAAGNPGQEEGFMEGYLNILSDRGSNIRGNLSGSLTTTFAASGSQNGQSQDLDHDGDKDLGSRLAFQSDALGGPMSDGDYLRAKAASMVTTFSGTAIPNGREFKLATIIFDVTSIQNPLDNTPTALNIFIANFKLPIEIEAVWQEDGFTSSMTPTPGGTFPSGFPVAGSPVLLYSLLVPTPEPSATLLLLTGGVLSLASWRTRLPAATAR